ncbi:hypothetical protein N9H60_00915 [Flavimaricola sp.]|nr:hypothetical protein [Flavimaricola sp.]
MASVQSNIRFADKEKADRGDEIQPMALASRLGVNEDQLKDELTSNGSLRHCPIFGEEFNWAWHISSRNCPLSGEFKFIE